MSRRIPTYLADPEAAAVVQRRAANLRRLRRELNLSAPVLARRAGIDHSYFYEVENGRLALATLRQLDRLAKAFDMSAADLLAELDKPTPLDEWSAANKDATCLLL